MPLVDVTDILLDTDIAGQSFVVLRRQETVNSFGESTVVTTRIPGIGSVQPSGDNALIREEGQDAQAESIAVVTAVRLRGVAKGPNATRFKPDIIFWNSNYYEVRDLKGWGQFGVGFVEAECTAIKYVDNPVAPALPQFAQLDFSRNVNSGYAAGAGG